MPPRRTCIGVFDSGFGGLTVLKALLRLIPDADYIYFGDTARLPYGSKSAETVARYAVGAAHYLEQQGAQALVIACNTATALAMDKITEAANVPVVGVIEPGTDRAAGESENKKVVVIGTEATVSSHAYLKALETRGIEAREKACPLLVPLVEEGWTDHRVTEEVAQIYLKEAFTDGFKSADVLLLGCTHYPLIQPILRRVAPKHVKIVDSADATADAVGRLLRRMPLSSTPEPERRRLPRLRCFATDSAEKFRRMGAQFLGQPIDDVRHVNLPE
ncbi:MAG TPA: glutamate racemase [Terriglobales bacterium]|jgi:glutamate racemase|nr:glutamate racemase [Terriglobales bacterium]